MVQKQGPLERLALLDGSDHEPVTFQLSVEGVPGQLDS
jgi:hypothetical protein